MSSAGPKVIEGEEQTDHLLKEQGELLLRTKLFFPSIRSAQVARPRLVKQINFGLEKPLTLVCAPAGYGKTTLVSSWLRGTDIPSAWFALDEADNDPVRFLRYFLAALQEALPTLRLDAVRDLQGMQPAPQEPLLNMVLNEIAGHDHPFILVLDDFHLIQAQPVLNILAYLLDHLPSQMHLVLISRTDPPLPLAQLRARNQLLEIRIDQLRFSEVEVDGFLNEIMGLRLSADEIAALEARTEGWIAGLQLAALSMKGCKDIQHFVSAFTGSHYYIMDYLTEEVLRLQPERLRAFLLQTSILNSMCGPLCDAVIGDAELIEISRRPAQFSGQNSQGVLEYLERSNLFLSPLDAERRWYRYHPLFADVLNRNLEQHLPQRISDLHRRASQWYEEHTMLSEAIRHALLAGDADRAARLVEQHGCFLLISGEVFTLMNWIEAVEPYARSCPWLPIQKAWALTLNGEFDRVEPTLQAAECLISSLEPTGEVRTMLGTIAADRAHCANLTGNADLAADFARQALEYLPEDDPLSRSLRCVATSLIGDASWLQGHLVEASTAYAESVRIGQTIDNIHMEIIPSCNLADILVEQGQLRRAARIYSGSLEKAIRPDGQRSPIAGRVYAGLSRVYYEWNQLEEAQQFAQKCVDLGQQWMFIEHRAVGYVVLARLEQIRGNQQKAREAMGAVERLAEERYLSPNLSAWVDAALGRLWIAQGDLEGAVRLIQQSGISLDDERVGEIAYLQEYQHLVRLRLYLAQGEYDRALALSERFVQTARRPYRGASVIEALVLQALSLQGKNNLAEALAVLEKALSLARPEGYVRTFLDEGEPMAKLLYQSKAQRMGAGYAADLLAALGRTSGPAQFTAGQLIEPLTPRELEVLKLIDAGYSNQDIAAHLFISMPTVKRHISNIYTKLGASSRTQAISLGRELNLFE